jgi:polyisoprenoid-binding protein YceI
MKGKIAIVLELVMLTGRMHAQAATWQIDPVHTQATFQVKHLAMTNIRGSISNVTGIIVFDSNDSSQDYVTAKLDVKTLNTANDYRDKFVKGPDFFNTARFPTITFTSTSVHPEGNEYKVVGNLTIAGVTKTVVLDVDAPTSPQKGMEGEMVGLSATTVIKRSDFNFGAKYPDAMVGDDVKITIDLEMQKK